MQRATGQYDRLARIPGTGPRQSSSRGPFAPGYRCRATPRPARGMEPTVRRAWTQSTIGSDAARAHISTVNSRALANQFVLKFRPRGTEFLDAETGAQEPAGETTVHGRDPKRPE